MQYNKIVYEFTSGASTAWNMVLDTRGGPPSMDTYDQGVLWPKTFTTNENFTPILGLFAVVSSSSR